MLTTLSEFLQFIASAFGRFRLSRDSLNVSIRCPIPTCKSHGDEQKFKLAIRVTDHFLHCWVCGFKARSMLPLLLRFASRDSVSVYREKFKCCDLANPPQEMARQSVVLPIDFRILALASKSDWRAQRALSYVRSRGLRDADLWRFKLGVSDDPDWADRVIIPSFDRDGELNFYTGRAVVPGTVSYKNCDANKNDIVFNELHVDMSERIVICEGPFDLFKCGENAVPLLGSNMSEDSALTDVVLSRGTPVAIALDADMREKAHRIGKRLAGYGIDVLMVDLGGRHDPGGMTRAEFSRRLAVARPWSWQEMFDVRLSRAASVDARIKK